MARDVKEWAGDKDGLERNLAKLKVEGEKMQDAARKAMQGDSHDKAMNVVTEVTRASPYGMAHLVVAVVVVLVIALVVALVI